MKKTINKKENFTSIHNKLINDSRISLKAKGIMLYMLSKPENWKYNPKEIAKNSKDGLDSVYSGIKELIEAGYISRTRHSDGTVDYFVFEDVEENDIVDFSKKENPNRENPNRENPNRENPDVYKRKNTNKERIIVNTELKKETSKSDIDDFINSQDKSEEYKELLFEFLKYRKKIRDTVKTSGPIKLLLKHFKTEADLREALEYMDLYNWKTAEPSWIEKKKNGSNNKNNNDFIVTEESLAETFGRYK
nr:MAG TPA: Dna polymerase B [Caudoviricetes sp.]